MPIADITHRLPRVGKIRLGEQVPAGKGSRPSKLETFRVTSQSEHVIEAVSAAYGGQVTPWAAPDGTSQFQVTIEANAIDVLITPGDDAFSQWNECWTAAGIQRRCDGLVEQLTDTACVCPADKDQRAELAKTGKACKPTTRVSVVLPKIPALGSFTMETHGVNAASELASTFALLDMTGARNGRLLPARLRLEQRVSRRDGETKRFAVPVLEIPMSLDALVESFGELPPAGVDATTGEIGGATQAALPAPVTSAKKAAARKQAAQKSTTEMSREVRANDPITAEQLAGFQGRIAMLDPEHRSLCATLMNNAKVSLKTTPKKSEAGTINDLLLEVEAKQAEAWEDRRKAVHAALPAGTSDDDRHAVVLKATGGATESTKTLTQEQANAVLDEIERRELDAVDGQQAIA